MRPTVLPTDPTSFLTLRKFPKTAEIVFIFLFTYFICGIGLFTAVNPYIHTNILMLRGWISHIPMLFIPYVWYKIRVSPLFSTEEKKIFTWKKDDSRLLVKIVIWYVPIVFLLNLSALQTSFYSAFHSTASAISITIFECVFVGLSEEMMVRPALQLPLSILLKGNIQIGRLSFSYSVLVTALLFGGMHMINLLYQSFPQTVLQSVYAFLLAVLIGYYYERTRNYLGAALLHGINDGLGPLMVIASAIVSFK